MYGSGCASGYGSGRVSGSGTGVLCAQCLLECMLRIGDKLPIANLVDKDARTGLRIMRKLGEHIEVAPVRPKKNVAGQSMQHSKCMFEILGYTGVADGVVRSGDKMVLRPKADTAYDDDVAQCARRLAWDMRAHRPGGTATRVARGLMCCERHAAEGYSVSVMEDAIYM